MNAVLASEVPENSPATIAGIINAMAQVRDERRAIAAKDKTLVAQWEALAAQLKAKLKEQGLEMGSSPTHTASVTKEPVPVVEDWDAFHAYIRDTDAFHLQQRRLAIGACREMFDAGQPVPGVRMIETEEVSLRVR